MFLTSCVSTLSVLRTTDLPGTCASLQPCFCAGVLRYVDACYDYCGTIGGSCLIYTVCSGLNGTSGIAVQHAALNRSIHVPCYLPTVWLVVKMLIMICPNLYWLLHPKS